MRAVSIAVLCTCALLISAPPSHAQEVGSFKTSSGSRVFNRESNSWKLSENVEVEDGDTRIFADEAEFFVDEDRLLLRGNVTVHQSTGQISADRAEFNVKTRLGTFHNASGIATLKPPVQRPRPGMVAMPVVTGQDTDVYFFGETVEKIGPKKYRITKGGFTTCVQPTPRWDLHADTVVLNVEHYTMLRNAVLKVKGVPMLYLPVLYYPTKKEDRATGFLIPTYGSSTLRGQQIHNAFFWAINRSQDATFMHDFYSLVGQGYSGQYRYNYGGGSDGTFSSYLLDQHESTYTTDTVVSKVPASRSFELRGGANQILPFNMHARGNVNYFSSVTTMQTFNTNVLDASRSQRTYGGNVVGAWRGYSLNGTYNKSEYFYNSTDSVLTGGAPRINFSRTERQIAGSPVYFSFGGEYADLLQERKSVATTTVGGVTTKKETVISQDVTRIDIAPQVRVPFKHWQWFNVNASLTWRDTYYTRSLDARGTVVDDPLNRRYVTVQAQMLGPIFNRVWDTPNNGYAEKFKHSIEPMFTITRTSAIDDFAKIVYNDGTDRIVGGATQYTYGLTNRLFAKQKTAPGQRAVSREILGVDINQSYYTDPLVSQYDIQYQTSYLGAAPTKFSPISLSVRAMPSTIVNATLRAEVDARYHAIRTFSANGTITSRHVQSTAGWSRRFLIPDLQGFNDQRYLDHFINASTTVKTADNRIGGVYSFNYDVLRSSMLQQRISGYYNAQCCGIAFEFQSYNFAGLGAFVPVAADHRFFLSFTLAGLGNFSPFNGALSGVPR